MENTEHSKIAFLAFVFPHTNIPSCSSEAQPRAMQAAESQGCSQANSWLIEVILKVGWDWTKQSKSLFKPTQICLYLYEIVNWVLKDFRLLLYWLMFQIFLLPVLKSFLLPILIECSLCGSAAQAHPAARMGESSVPLVWSQLHKVTWEGQPGLGRAVSTHPPGSHCSWCRRQEKKEEGFSPAAKIQREHKHCSHFTPLFTLEFEAAGKWNQTEHEAGGGPALCWLGQHSWDGSSWRGRALAAAAPEAGRSGSSSIPICQSCVQSQAVTALVLFHHIPALPLTPSSSHRQKINFRDTRVLSWPLASKTNIKLLSARGEAGIWGWRKTCSSILQGIHSEEQPLWNYHANLEAFQQFQLNPSGLCSQRG